MALDRNDFKTDLRTYFITEVTGWGTRLYETLAPQDATAPFGVLTQIAESHDVTHDFDPHRTLVFQLDIYGATGETVDDICGHVEAAIDGLRGDVGGYYIGAAWMTNKEDLYDDTTELRRVRVEFELTINAGQSGTQGTGGTTSFPSAPLQDDATGAEDPDAVSVISDADTLTLRLLKPSGVVSIDADQDGLVTIGVNEILESEGTKGESAFVQLGLAPVAAKLYGDGLLTVTRDGDGDLKLAVPGLEGLLTLLVSASVITQEQADSLYS